jgi:hypothetical protein
MKNKIAYNEYMQKPSWKMRRRAVFGTLIFCASIITYIIFVGNEKAVYETAVFSAFGLMGAIIASYIGGAVWDDYNMKKVSAQEQEGDQ